MVFGLGGYVSVVSQNKQLSICYDSCIKSLVVSFSVNRFNKSRSAV